jgi:hypothetical protein
MRCTSLWTVSTCDVLFTWAVREVSGNFPEIRKVLLPVSARHGESATVLTSVELHAPRRRTATFNDLSMTKRSRDSATASTNSEPPDRHASHDAEGIGGQEDAEGSALKKARSFMATLVREVRLSHDQSSDITRRAMYAARERHVVMRTSQNVAIARLCTWSVLTKHHERPKKINP